MARWSDELPLDVIRDVEKLEKDVDKMMGEMTKAGADVVVKNVKGSAPPALRQYVKTTVTYKTPSDDGIATKVYIGGYIPFKPPRTTFTRKGGGGSYSTTKGIPASFLAILYEYGRSTSPFPKKPFFRKSFKKAQIEKAMSEVEKRYLPND